MRSVVAILLATSILLSGPTLALAGGNGKKKGQDIIPLVAAPAGGLSLSLSITASEQQIIQGYIQGHRPTFAGAKPLPPGIAKKLARGGGMPPGIAKRYFPTELSTRLPPRPGQSWVIVGTDVLLISVSTNAIIDVLHDMF